MTANALNNLARTQAERGDYREAEKLYQKAAAIWERSGSLTHQGYASVLGNWGVLLAQLHRYEEADRLHRESPAVLRSCCGEDHPDYAGRLADHAIVLRKLDRKDEANIAGARAASLQQMRRGADSSFIVDIEDLGRKQQ